jgi:hypothetical protein
MPRQPAVVASALIFEHMKVKINDSVGEVVSIDYKRGEMEALFAGDLLITLSLENDPIELIADSDIVDV